MNDYTDQALLKYIEYRGRNTALHNYRIYLDCMQNSRSLAQLAKDYHYHKQTIYDKIKEVERFFSSYKRYESACLPNRAHIIGNVKGVEDLVKMTFSSYQYDLSKRIPIIDLKVRHPGIKNNRAIYKVIDGMYASKLKYAPMTVLYDLGELTYEPDYKSDTFLIYWSVSYEPGVLLFEFSQRIAWLLDMFR